MLQYADDVRATTTRTIPNQTARKVPAQTARTVQAQTARPIPVAVHALDPLSRAGVVSHLRQCPEITLLDDDDQPAGTRVALLVADTFDEAALAGLSRLVKADRTRVVLVLDRIQEPELLNVVSLGVTTILWRREVTGERLRQAVRTAARGHGDLPPDLLGKLIGCMGRQRTGDTPETGPADYGMLPREVDVLRLVADGMDTGEIAVKLLYSERTIKNIIHTVTTRFQLRNRAHAVAYALREGYI
ncbi:MULTISPECIES: LuxR C-terminal-related transcriptional regulator [Kitasatospora]|uniref:Putative LuxR family transcriptional regulator n=1 Tax=Kitasatospora setae (strain ATCC 33774 / DSM 43861 / JCM 3304 / KCC A-0304 / NBRC 14216 / KM-6054) TaxID=452652 RepID=E4N2Y0_KITSK|nr:LuxR C-terminal-related transcriptional regulator [Kitasatospora setae]BAJ32514.1 putative LuxR family transcriptional regulator [Kitasatospora setae KM-6054]